MIKPLISDIFDPSAVTAGFTTREGGVSRAPYDSLNLGMSTGDCADNVTYNRRLICEYAGIPESNAAIMKQVHGASVTVVNKGGLYSQIDGLITSTESIMLCVQVADCVPLLLFDPVKKIVAALHCGWRPLIGGIIDTAIEMMKQRFGSISRNVLAMYGPGAGLCCYEVGGEIAVHFDKSSVFQRNGSFYADIPAEIVKHLTHAGLMTENIHGFNLCTICHPDQFFSYRRDGKDTGRMMGFILLKGARG